MKTDSYTSIPGWHISLEEFLQLMRRPKTTPATVVRNTLEVICREAPWFDPDGIFLPRAPHPIFRNESEPAE